MLHRLNTSQFLKSDPETLWNFISSPANLADITPSYMGFNILGDPPAAMYPGQLIEYTVSPVLGIKLNWVTEITHVREGVFFVDEQRFGPYSFWHHKHWLEATDGGTIMHDDVHYKLPLGFLGRLAGRIFVKRQLQEIFDYRRHVLDERFNGA